MSCSPWLKRRSKIGSVLRGSSSAGAAKVAVSAAASGSICKRSSQSGSAGTGVAAGGTTTSIQGHGARISGAGASATADQAIERSDRATCQPITARAYQRHHRRQQQCAEQHHAREFDHLDTTFVAPARAQLLG
ncbi:hypothetical protein HC891_02210 [Candidatus Gracilibacteria bacterium]|nr:hypothetical protein [Candidatus Gracilibacteria bacterium]